MWCIFCQKNNKHSEEHIIPESIGGSVITYQICKACNSKLGSEVDSVLNKNRFIFDAYEKVKPEVTKELKFNFIKSTFRDNEDFEIKVAGNNLSKKIQPSKISDNHFRIDSNDNKFVINYIKKKGEKKGISKEVIQNHINDFLYWSKSKKEGGDSYSNELFELKMESKSVIASRETVMSATTPHRFLAKAAVEFTYLLELQNGINSLETLRKHAIYGNQLKNIRCNQEQVTENAIPFHIIAFHKNQFQILFFGSYGFSINIQIDFNYPDIVLANDINNEVLLVCEPEVEELRITNHMLQFDWGHLNQ